MPTTLEKSQAIMDLAQRKGVEFINLQFSDLAGMVKSVTIPLDQFEACVEHGKWFDGSSIEGFARIAESDMYLVPDLSTFAILPWDETSARVICWVYTPDGEPFAGDPRYILKRVMDEAKELGYVFNTGPELEFFLFSRSGVDQIAPHPHDQGGYFDLSTDLAAGVRKDMVRALQAMGIEVETDHHEVAAGQHEIAFKFADALTTADNAVTFRYTLKAIAQRHGLFASFMPKPLFGVNGSGMHVHQSFFGEGANAFYDPGDPYGLSQVARHFIAGQLKHAKGMSAVLAPLVNSYKRLVPGYEAPCYISWARNNRSALIRIPRINPKTPKSTRIELRCPDPSTNPYLAFAVMLQAGLDGLKRKLELPNAIEEDLYHMSGEDRVRHGVDSLPGSLGEAIQAMEEDGIVRKAMGDHLYERFLEAKQLEWDSYRMSVSPWELERYLAIY
ncbi:MAG TPA: type I glutamate--ammonia ligase [Chroococcales cyanobacterium]